MALRAWNVSRAFEKRAPGPLSFAIFFAISLHLRHPFVHMTNIIEFVFFKTPPPSLDSVLTPARLYGYVSWGSNQIYSAWSVTKFAKEQHSVLCSRAPQIFRYSSIYFGLSAGESMLYHAFPFLPSLLFPHSPLPPTVPAESKRIEQIGVILHS